MSEIINFTPELASQLNNMFKQADQRIKDEEEQKNKDYGTAEINQSIYLEFISDLEKKHRAFFPASLDIDLNKYNKYFPFILKYKEEQDLICSGRRINHVRDSIDRLTLGSFDFQKFRISKGSYVEIVGMQGGLATTLNYYPGDDFEKESLNFKDLAKFEVVNKFTLWCKTSNLTKNTKLFVFSYNYFYL